MRKASFNASLPTVNSLSSHEGSQASSHHSTTSGNRRPSRNSTNSTQGSSFNRGMKRSPYLSAMAIDNHESEDLVVALSRPGRVASVSPEGTGGGGGGGGTGGMGFFNLKRPGSWTGQQMQEEGLQRPQGVQGQGQQGGLQLQRPQQGQSMGGGITPVSSEGTTTTVGTEDHPNMSVDESDDGNGGGEGNAHFPSVAPSALKQTGGGATGGANTGGRAARMPSLRSALRVNSSAQLQQSSQREGTTTTNNNTNNNSGGGMKKNTSVTFSMNTKNPSRLGLQFANNTNDEGGAAADTAAVGSNDAFPLFANNNPRASKDYSASGMMRKSQSICAPEYLLSHSPAGSSSGSGGGSGSAHSGGGGATGSGEGEGNASFPIYFAKLGGGAPQSQAPQQGLPPQPQLHQSNQEQIRRKSKSMNTLQYSYQNEELLSSTNSSNANNNNACGNKLFGALGITPSSRVNLKFRDMLDEGDGNEGDLNLRLRNQQWKDFRMFSKEFESENPMLVSIEEGGAASGGGAALTTVDSGGGDGGAGATPMSTNVKPSTSSLSGSKRAISPSSTSGQTSSHSTSSKTAAAFMNSFGSHRQLNSHRASVSVNDLAMLRRSAARMRVGPSSNNSSSSNRSFATTTTTSSPGATLGGEMLSRISSRNSMMSINSSTGSGGNAAAAAATENTLSPLAQMMAKSANLSSKQQQDLFLSKAKYQMSNDTTSSSAAAAGMGRRVHTVGAGLAYGGPNLSRFDLGSLRKDLSIMSGGSGSSGAGKNEEWDL